MNGAEQNGLSTCITLKQDPNLFSCTKIRLKWIKDLNIRPETLKVLQEKIGKTLENIDIEIYFPNRTPTAQEIRLRIDKWNCIKF
jgi:hypothetical protein